MLVKGATDGHCEGITLVHSGAILISFGSGIVNMLSKTMQLILIKYDIDKLAKTISFGARSLEMNH